ncbi:MAG: LD-carboxypeptidase [candidate division Zixibacteria bacterium]|nr:LD-carboxypeptidase [candidate division Zixibacteria bacterium]
MKLLKPKALFPGATIGIIAPSSWAKDARLRRGLKWLAKTGFKVRLFLSPKQKYGFLSGPDFVRARLFNRAFADPEVDAVICARGGYGALRMLDKIDFDFVHRHPKIFVGFSDITAIHLALYKKTGLSSFHGPMAADFGTAYNRQNLLRMLSSKMPAGKVPFPKNLRPRFMRRGVAAGPLLGGNLSLIVKLFGTPYQPSFKGAILFLEDVGEYPHRIDGYLAQLRLARVFDQIAGLILADFKDCERSPRPGVRMPLRRIFEDFFGRAPFPVALGFPFGHSGNIFTLPLGVQAVLDSGKGSLILQEGGVV